MVDQIFLGFCENSHSNILVHYCKLFTQISGRINRLQRGWRGAVNNSTPLSLSLHPFISMARIYPQSPSSSSSSSPPSSPSSYMTSKRETFTVWMKSLVYHGNGCTVFDSNGEIVYRIDNYNTKCSREVHLMDLHGRVLFSIRQKVRFFLCFCHQEATLHQSWRGSDLCPLLPRRN